MLITGGCVTSHVHIRIVGLKRLDFRTQLPMLATVISDDRATPVAGGGFPFLVNHHAIMRDCLCVVVG